MTFIGFVSDMDSVCDTYHWLNWVCKLPKVVIGLIQGFLSTFLLLILVMLLPIMMRKMARLEGIPQKTGVELILMDRFFVFLVIVRVSCALLDESLTKVR